LSAQAAQKDLRGHAKAEAKAKAEVDLNLDLNLDLLGRLGASRSSASFDGAQDNRPMSLFQQLAWKEF
jgi:hypothetical protein